MEREIRFRGKRIDNGEWVYGYLLRRYSMTEIYKPSGTIPIIPETVGQFTGLEDKNGKEIYEGDKFQYRKNKGYLLDDFIGIIKFEDGCFGYEVIDGQVYRSFTSLGEFDELQEDFLDHIEVIGNIHNNPELIANLE